MKNDCLSKILVSLSMIAFANAYALSATSPADEPFILDGAFPPIYLPVNPATPTPPVYTWLTLVGTTELDFLKIRRQTSIFGVDDPHFNEDAANSSYEAADDELAFKVNRSDRLGMVSVSGELYVSFDQNSEGQALSGFNALRLGLFVYYDPTLTIDPSPPLSVNIEYVVARRCKLAVGGGPFGATGSVTMQEFSLTHTPSLGDEYREDGTTEIPPLMFEGGLSIDFGDRYFDFIEKRTATAYLLRHCENGKYQYRAVIDNIYLNGAISTFNEVPEAILYVQGACSYVTKIVKVGTKNVDSGFVNADINADGFIGFDDLDLIIGAFGLSIGDAGYAEGIDVNRDDFIGFDDVDIVSANFGNDALTFRLNEGIDDVQPPLGWFEGCQ